MIEPTYSLTSSNMAWSSMTTPRYSLLNSSRITRTAMSGSRYSRVGPVALRPASAIASHWRRRRSTSLLSSSSTTFSAAVRTMTPCSAGLTLSRMERRRLRSSSGSRLEMP